MLAEEKQAKTANGETSDEQEAGGWHTTKVDSPTVISTLKNLSLIYRRQGKYDAAEILDQVAQRSSRQQAERFLQSKAK